MSTNYVTDKQGIQNVLNVRQQIDEKVQSLQLGKKYFPTLKQIKGTMVDVDSYPYQRLFRDNVFEEKPTIWDREAGWHPIVNNCNYPVPQINYKTYNICYQPDCNLNGPCYSRPEEKSFKASCSSRFFL